MSLRILKPLDPADDKWEGIQRHGHEGYDCPQGCEAIVAVGEDGSYVFLKSPKLVCLEVEPKPQDSGFPQDFSDMAPGVYRMVFKYDEYYGYDGLVEDWNFTPMDTVALALYDSPKWWNPILGREVKL